MNAEINDLIVKLEATGLGEVKAGLVSGRYRGIRENVVREWVHRKESSLSAEAKAREEAFQASQADIASRAADAAATAADAARSQARTAKAALIIAAMALAVSIVTPERL